MGDLVPTTAPATATAAAKHGYLAPHLRGGAKEQEKEVKLDVANFPSLGLNPSKSAKTSWNKVTTVTASSTIPTLVPTVQTPVNLPNFKATVDACLEKERLDQAQKEKQPETDFNKMTREEKEADGWTMLPLNRAAVVSFIDTLEEQEFPECTGTFTFAEMAALCTEYEKRADKEMNIYRDKTVKV
jgi:hypothetical protein